MTKRANDGFTLVELLVSILAASIVTLAACTVLLLGVRINAQSTGVVTQQNTARVFMTALENMAAEGVITRVSGSTDQWDVWGESKEPEQPEEPVLTYSKVAGAETGTISARGGVLVENVRHSTIEMDESGLLTCTLITQDGEYELSVYCRTVDTAKTEARNAKRNAFLQKLVSQFQTNDGEFNPGFIIEDGTLTKKTYFEWYDTNWTDAGEKGWCACFVSWALAEAGPADVSLFAYVDDTETEEGTVKGFLTYFRGSGPFDENGVNEKGHQWKPASKGYIPTPGDLVFMDTKNGGYADHIGVVISVAGGYVYTIEGSVEETIPNEDNQPEPGTDTEPGIETDTESDTKTIYIVQLKKYELSDNTILGYGVLNWD